MTRHKLNIYNKLFCTVITCIYLSINFTLSQSTNTEDGARTSNRLNGSDGVNISGETRAVIVGVSAYSNLPKEKQLNFADDDAKEFYEFLIKQPNIDKDNIVLLTDEEAVLSKVNAAIRQQMRSANEGDTFIFFFAGHGDVQKTADTGYLLLHEVNLGNEYSWDDAYSLNDLELNATTFTKRKKGKVLLITDACHSGKLVTDNEYAKAFTTGLVQSWENTVKMVSCEPFQVSFEDIYWGGGNGVFTYYLLEALSGKADRLEVDKLVSVRELKKYVTDKVSNDVKERKGVYQDPKFEGMQDINFFKIDPTLAERLSSPILASNATNNTGGRGLSSESSQDLNEYTKRLLNDFEQAIEDSKLIERSKSKTSQNLFITEDDVIINGMSPIISLLFDMKNNSMYTIENNRVLTEYDVNNFSEKTKYRLPVLAKSYEIDTKNNVLIASSDNSIKIISTRNWADVLNTLPIEVNSNNANKFTNVGENLIYNSKKNIIEIWDTRSWKKLANFKAGKTQISALEVIEQTKKVIVSDVKNNLYVYDFKGNLETKLKGHNGIIYNLFISPDQSKIISVAKGGELIAWNTSNFSIHQKLNLPSINTEINAFSPDSQFFVTSNSKQLILLNLTDKNPPYLVDFDTKNLKYISFATQNELFYTRNNIVGKLQFTRPTKYATSLYEQLLKQPDIAPIKEYINRKLTVALTYEAQQIIKPFALGEEVVPSVSEVEIAIKQLEYAIKITEEEFSNKSVLEAKKQFLQGYQILLKYDVENYPLAIKHFEKVAELEPDAAYPNNALSLVYNKLNELSTAKEKLDKAISATPRWYEPKSNLGITLMREGKFDSARVEFKKIIELYPSLSKGYYNMSKWHFALGDYKNSEKSIEMALEVDAENPSLIVQAAKISKVRGQLNKARALLKLAIEKADTYYKPYLELAELGIDEYYNYAGQTTLIEEAQELLLKANELSDYLPEVNQSLAAFYLTVYKDYPKESTTLPSQEKCLELANQFIKRAELLAPLDTKTHSVRADYFTIKGNFNSANNALRNHLKKTSNFPEGYIAFGKYLMNYSNETLNVEKQLGLATTINPNYIEGHVALAEYYDTINKVQLRDSVLLNAQQLFPNSPVFTFLQGKYWIREAENKNEGVLAIRRALDIDPSFKYASTALYAVGADQQKNIIDIGYDFVQRLVDNKMLAKKNNHYFFTDITGIVVSKTYYDKVDLLGKGKMLLSRNGLVGYQDIANDITIPIEYEKISLQKVDNSLIVQKEQKEGWLNAQGEVIVPLDYEEIRLMKAGTIRVKKDGLFGVVSKEYGSLLTKIKYSKITDGVWSTGNVPIMCCYFGENESDAIDGNGKRLGSCNSR